MANQTIYPYGTNGELPSSIGLVNDFATGGVDKALTAEQGKVLFEDISKIISDYEVFSGTWTTSGTFSSNYPTTHVYSIPNSNYKYFASFRVISSNLPTYLSVVFLDENYNVVGYDASYHAYPTYNVFGVLLTNIPSTAKKIGLWNGSQDPTITELRFFEDNDFFAESKIRFLEKSLGANLPFTEIKPQRVYANKFISKATATAGELIDTPSGISGFRVSEYDVDETNNYAATFSSVYKDYDSMSVAYYDKNGTFISGDIYGRYRNDTRNRIYNYPLAIPTGTKFVRLLYSGSVALYRYTTNKLFGKKISVIGDSIPTSYSQYTTAYMRITPAMVGQQIQSYVTYYDIHGQESGTTGKTIGGVTLTDSMNDVQLHTFTPVSGDVGKELGVPKYYAGNNGILPWPYLLGRLLGCYVAGNASYSASGITTARENLGAYERGSAAWRDYTIARCKDYDIATLDVVNPDIIIIARGLNDFSRTDISGSDNLGSLTLDDYNLLGGLDPQAVTTDIEDNVYQFKKAYYTLILKLRAQYPKAIVVCATLNFANPRANTTWPPRNNKYTLSDFNNAIREIANTAGCPLIEFDKDGITMNNFYTEGYIEDSQTAPTHPTSKGHWVMAVKAWRDLKDSLPLVYGNI